MKIAKTALFFIAAYLVLFPPQAHAYLDPGTGSYIIQVLAAVIFAGLFVLKTWWTQVKYFVSKLFGRGKETKKSEKNSTKG